MIVTLQMTMDETYWVRHAVLHMARDYSAKLMDEELEIGGEPVKPGTPRAAAKAKIEARRKVVETLENVAERLLRRKGKK